MRVYPTLLRIWTDITEMFQVSNKRSCICIKFLLTLMHHMDVEMQMEVLVQFPVGMQ